MTGFLGILLIIISAAAGYNEWHYWLSIIPLSVGGMILYFLQSPAKNLIVFAQDGWPKLLGWIAWVFFAQGLTWSIFYWIGTLFR